MTKRELLKELERFDDETEIQICPGGDWYTELGIDRVVKNTAGSVLTIHTTELARPDCEECGEPV